MHHPQVLKHAIRLLFGVTLGLTTLNAAALSPAAKKPVLITSVGQSILEAPLADGVSLDDAVESMKLRANQINFKLVAELPLSKQVEVMTGQNQRRMTIYQFCDAPTAMEMVNYNQAFVTFLPCRISVVEDANGKGHILMTDLSPMIQAANLPPLLRTKAATIQAGLLNIMMAGANGDL